MPRKRAGKKDSQKVTRTLCLKMRGRLRDINSYSGAVGGLANDYDVEID